MPPKSKDDWEKCFGKGPSTDARFNAGSAIDMRVNDAIARWTRKFIHAATHQQLCESADQVISCIVAGEGGDQHSIIDHLRARCVPGHAERML